MKKILMTASVLAITAGILLSLGAVWGIYFIYTNVSRENIVTPQDAAIPGKAVRGPFTLKAQADVIRMHTLRATGGKTYAEMPRQIAQLDAAGNPVLDKDGQPVMAANTARDTWVTATALMTALHLGILTYAFCGMILLFGLVSIVTGLVFRAQSKAVGA